ncbi:hypothetical protein AbraIFM66950_009867 [Aspergillus brasiliensis]|nr:hypothetical protein AbraIFM66950_009867 [Aspergillus brasiliensis]
MCLIKITFTREVKITRNEPDMAPPPADHTIQQLIKKCRVAFTKCLALPELCKGDWAQKHLLEYNSWVYNAGSAFIPGQESEDPKWIDDIIKGKRNLSLLHQYLMTCKRCAEENTSCEEAMRNVELTIKRMNELWGEVQPRLEKEEMEEGVEDHL